MGLLSRLFGGRIDSAAVAPAPVAALPYGFAEFGRQVHLRVCYSPDSAHLSDFPLIHRALHRCTEARERRRGAVALPWEAAHHRFAPVCVRLPPAMAGPVPVRIRDFFFRRSELPPDFSEAVSFYPLWLVDRGDPVGRFLEGPAATPGERARQRLRLAQRRGARPVRAALVQANARLFVPGADDLPCLVAFSFNDRLRDDQLLETAHRVAEYKGTHPAEHEQAFVAELTTDERFVYYRRDRLPRSVTKGPEIYVAHLYVHRPFLPGGDLSGHRLLTCLAEPGERGMFELLPPDGKV
jgi:hypothetical protein